MSKEMIEKLREDGKFLGGNFGKLMHEAAAYQRAQQPQSGLTEAEPGCFVQPVPSHCDRITWRGQYYHLPITTPQPSAGVVMPERRECDDGYPSDDWLCVTAWNACLDEFARLNKGAGSHE